MIDVNNTGLKRYPVDVYLKGNIRWWAPPVKNTNSQTNPLGVRDLNLKDWIQWAYDNGHLDFSGTGGGSSSVTVSTVADVTAMNNIASPAEGDVAYLQDGDGNANPGISVYTGTSWTTPVLSFPGSYTDYHIGNTDLYLSNNRSLSLGTYSFNIYNNGSTMRMTMTPSLSTFEMFINSGIISVSSNTGTVLVSTQTGIVRIGNSISNSTNSNLTMSPNSASSLNIGSSTGGFTIVDNRVTARGVQYNADYSATYNSRSLVDKEYVDDAIAGVVSGSTTDEKVKVSTNDTTSKTLTEAIDSSSAIVFSQINDGGNETIYIQERAYSGVSKETPITIPVTLNGVTVASRLKRQIITGTLSGSEAVTIPGDYPVDMAVDAHNKPVYAYFYGSYTAYDSSGAESFTTTINTYGTTSTFDSTQIVRAGINDNGVYVDSLQCDYPISYVIFMEYAVAP